MRTEPFSRRRFLRESGVLAGGALWPGGLTALFALGQSACTSRDAESAFRVLSQAEAVELEAIAARIIPATDTPGAREAGVIHFIDRAMLDVFPDRLGELRQGLAETAKNVADAFDDGQKFSDLTDTQQDSFLEGVEESTFFSGMRFLTFCGFFAMSKYGGNRGDAGWNLLGMDPHQRVWTYPFGYYDAEFNREQSNDD